MSKINYNTDVEYDTEGKKFRLTRGMIILAAIIIIVLIILIIVIVNIVNNKKESRYTDEDFFLLERRMEEEAPIYIAQKQVVLTEEEYKIELDSLLIENGGAINSKKVKATTICDGYVIAKKLESHIYESFISCGDLYTTSGYTSNHIEKEKTTTTTPKDIESPNLILKGQKEITIRIGEGYTEQGYVATDNVDGDITSKVKVSGSVNVKKAGQYVLVYSVSDKAGNVSEEKRIISVINVGTSAPVTTTIPATTSAPTTTRQATTRPVTQKPKTTTKTPKVAPTITLYGSKIINLFVGDIYKDPGYSATDCMGANITSKVRVSGTVNTKVATTYYINYEVTDRYGNRSVATRTIIVKVKNIPVSGISISPNNVILSPGTTKKLEVFISPNNATNKNVTWSSSNNSVATVSNGVISARAKGVATITAKTSNGKSYSVRVEVK